MQHVIPAFRQKLTLAAAGVLLVGELSFGATNSVPAKLVEELGSATENVRALAARTIADRYRVDFGIWGTDWYRRYCESVDDAVLDGDEALYFRALAVMRETDSAAVAPWTQSASSLLYRGVRDGSRDDLAEALACARRSIVRAEPLAQSSDAEPLARLLWIEANALFALGDTNATRQALRNYAQRNLRVPWGRGRRGYPELFAAARLFLDGECLDGLRLPRETDARAYPTPQEASYADDFTPLTAVRIVDGSSSPDEPRLWLLRVKYARYGIAFAGDAPFEIRITVDPATQEFADLDADYKRREAYALETTATGALIRAQTRQGALWGVVSLIQMTDPKRKAVRRAKLRDWPSVEKRGYLGTWWPNCTEFTLFQKMNSVCHQRHPCFENRFEPLAWMLEAELGRQFSELGLELFYGLCWLSHAPQLPISRPRTKPYRVSVLKRYARAGIGVYYPLDDVRFPVLDEDLRAYGSAAAIDAKHISELYREVIAECPGWRLIACPPFYWGPDGRANAYPERRDDYLARWRQDLDPGIEVYWTGPRVKSGRFLPYHNEWALKSYGRRPYLFQNGTGWHNLLEYTIDEMPWPKMYCSNTLDKALAGYHLNSHTPGNCAKIAALADALWNTPAYSGSNAVRRACAQLMGARMHEVLLSGYADLCHFDNYRYGAPNDDLWYEDPADLSNRVARLDAVWASARSLAEEEGVPLYGDYGRGVGFAHDVLKALRTLGPPSRYYARQIADTADVALRETNLDEEMRDDVLLDPTEWRGGRLRLVKKAPEGTKEWEQEKGRLSLVIAANETIAAEFRRLKVTDEQTLYVSAASDAPETPLTVTLNGKTVIRGKAKFSRLPRFTTRTFQIDAKHFASTNRLTITNGSDKPLRLSYVVLADPAEDQLFSP